MEKLLSITNLKKYFPVAKSSFFAKQMYVRANEDITLDIYKGETFSLVGESGSGKTTIGRAICRINPTSGGDIFFKGQKINGKISKELDKEVIRKIQMIFQDPMASLNERAKVEYIIAEGLLNHHLYKDQEDLHEKVMNALHEVGLLPEPAPRFPHEFSGGQRQRIGIARALVMEPEFIVADEPISALDMSIRAQVLNLLRHLQKERGITYLFIAHDLSVMRYISDRIAVMYAGDIVELGTCDEVFYDPRHPYTWALLSSLPQLGTKDEPLYSIQGTPPNLFHEVKGDAFAPRNPKALKIDFVERPPFFEVTPTHYARTWLMDPRAPKVEPPEHVRILREKGVNRVG